MTVSRISARPSFGMRSGAVVPAGDSLSDGSDLLALHAAERGSRPVENEYDLRVHRLHAAGPLSVRLSSSAEP